MKRRSFIVLLAIATVLASLAISSCGKKAEKEQISKEQRAREAKAYRAALKVGVLPTLDCLPVYLLKDSLLYDSTKADIRLKLFTAHMDVDTALVGGSVQMGVSDMVRAAFLGRRGFYLKTITGTQATWSLLTHQDEKVDSLKKLADKTIGMTRYSVTDMLTQEAIEKGKPASRAFPAQINDVSVRLKMLRNDMIEAAWFCEPQLTQAKLAGAHVLVDGSKDSTRMGVFVYHEDPMDDFSVRARQLDEFREAYNRACELINKNGFVYYTALLRKYMNLDDKTIRALPKIHYDGINIPRQKDVKRAKAFR